MTQKQIAVATGAVLVALAGVLAQCPEEPPPAAPVAPTVLDAGR